VQVLSIIACCVNCIDIRVTSFDSVLEEHNFVHFFPKLGFFEDFLCISLISPAGNYVEMMVVDGGGGCATTLFLYSWAQKDRWAQRGADAAKTYFSLAFATACFIELNFPVVYLFIVFANLLTLIYPLGPLPHGDAAPFPPSIPSPLTSQHGQKYLPISLPTSAFFTFCYPTQSPPSSC
jgi:hypothetical protein